MMDIQTWKINASVAWAQILRDGIPNLGFLCSTQILNCLKSGEDHFQKANKDYNQLNQAKLFDVDINIQKMSHDFPYFYLF